jgi:hypothetical protein
LLDLPWKDFQAVKPLPEKKGLSKNYAWLKVANDSHDCTLQGPSTNEGEIPGG